MRQRHLRGEPCLGPTSASRRVGRWSVAVCGPALYYYHEDFSVRMVEWLEILRAQGFARVFLSVTDIHPNLERVLRYYEAQGFVGMVRFSYPEPYVNEPSIRRWDLPLSCARTHVPRIKCVCVCVCAIHVEQIAEGLTKGRTNKRTNTPQDFLLYCFFRPYKI